MKTPVLECLLLDKVAHHQACNFINKRLQRRCFTMNFAKLLKAPCRTPLVSASEFNATFFTLDRERRTPTFSQHYFFDISKPLHVSYRN